MAMHDTSVLCLNMEYLNMTIIIYQIWQCVQNSVLMCSPAALYDHGSHVRANVQHYVTWKN